MDWLHLMIKQLLKKSKPGVSMKTAFLMFLIFSISVFSQSQNTLSLNAVKDTSVKADEMILEISVYKSDTVSAIANQSSHKSLINVLNVLKEFGYKNENIFLKESNFQNNNYQKPGNYSSMQTYRVIFNKFELYDTFKKELIDSGATGIRIVAFWSSRYQEIKRELYVKSIEAAKEKANFLSAQMGIHKVHIFEISDNSRDESNNNDISFINYPGSGMQADGPITVMAQAQSVAPTITNGQLLISVSLRITFKFE